MGWLMFSAGPFTPVGSAYSLAFRSVGMILRSGKHFVIQIGHDIIFSAIFSQKMMLLGQLSVTDEWMCWLTAYVDPAQEKCG